MLTCVSVGLQINFSSSSISTKTFSVSLAKCAVILLMMTLSLDVHAYTTSNSGSYSGFLASPFFLLTELRPILCSPQMICSIDIPHCIGHQSASTSSVSVEQYEFFTTTFISRVFRLTMTLSHGVQAHTASNSGSNCAWSHFPCCLLRRVWPRGPLYGPCGPPSGCRCLFTSPHVPCCCGEVRCICHFNASTCSFSSRCVEQDELAIPRIFCARREC